MPRLGYIWKMIFDGRDTPGPLPDRPAPFSWPSDAITGSCLGHSTVLMNMFGAWILTDPVFSSRVGPGIPPFILGPRRHFLPALSPSEFPSPEAIIVSHAHFDHLDTWSLRKFDRRIPIVTAVATTDLFRRLGFRNVRELRWGESTEIQTRAGPLTVSAIQVSHWGARMLRDVHRGYNGYVLERLGRSVCFAGDTAYTHAFAALRSRPAPLELMLMPIGAYDPWINAHCSPEQAAAMARDAGARYFVPMHHATFKLSSEAMDEPAHRIRAAFADEPDKLLAVQPGETFRVPLAEDRGEDPLQAADAAHG